MLSQLAGKFLCHVASLLRKCLDDQEYEILQLEEFGLTRKMSHRRSLGRSLKGAGLTPQIERKYSPDAAIEVGKDSVEDKHATRDEIGSTDGTPRASADGTSRSTGGGTPRGGTEVPSSRSQTGTPRGPEAPSPRGSLDTTQDSKFPGSPDSIQNRRSSDKKDKDKDKNHNDKDDSMSNDRSGLSRDALTRGTSNRGFVGAKELGKATLGITKGAGKGAYEATKGAIGIKSSKKFKPTDEK